MSEKGNSLRVSIAIPTYGRDDILVATVKSILCYLEPAVMELVVVDQTSEHNLEAEKQLRDWAHAGRIRWLRVSEPSLTGARNVALREANGEIVIFLDDDVLIHDAFIEEHMNLYNDSHVAGVTGQVFTCTDWRMPPDTSDPTVGTEAHFLTQGITDTENFIGCNHSVRRSAALAIGGYDTHFVGSAHCEDFDVAHRLVEGGYRLIYNPSAWLIHLHAPTGGCRVSYSKAWPEWTNTCNLLLYAFRHGRKRGNFWYYIRRSLRTGPGRKEIIMRPWRWPWAWVSWFRAFLYGYKYRDCVNGVKSV